MIRAGHCPEQLTRVGGPPHTFNRFYNKELFCRHVFKKKKDVPTKRVVEYSPIRQFVCHVLLGRGFVVMSVFAERYFEILNSFPFSVVQIQRAALD